MSRLTNQTFANSASLSMERKEIQKILVSVYRNGRGLGFGLGLRDGMWKFKCVAERLGISKEEYPDSSCITLLNSDISLIKEILKSSKDRLIREAKNNKEE